MLITFSGLDGAGKSTLAEWLRAELEREGRPATVLHLNDHVGIYAYARAARDRLLGRTSSDGPPRMAPRPTRLGRLRDALLWSTTLRRALYPVDLLIFLCYRAVIETLRGRVLLMDRYFYDTLVDVAEGHTHGCAGLLGRVTPLPDLAILLEIEPEEAFARKHEYTVEYLRRRNAGYRRVFRRLPAALRLPGRDLEAARRTLARIVAIRMRHDRAA